MPINAINVTMTVKPINAPCPPAGGVFTVTVTVSGRAAERGGSYDVSLYDQDVIWDDCLDSSVANGVLPGPFRRQHIFLLKCDAQCQVTGRLRSSGEQTAELYAWVNGGRNVTAMTPVVQVSCTSCPVPEQTTARKPATPKRAVGNK